MVAGGRPQVPVLRPAREVFNDRTDATDFRSARQVAPELTAAAARSGESVVPEWLSAMKRRHWYRLSGARPDLGLTPTVPGTRYLEDGDPAFDPLINPARTAKERLRRFLGRRPYAPWQGKMGFPAITEAWNSAVLASRFGESGSMVIFGGGHNTYFGSNVHAFDLASRTWARLSDGYVSGTPDSYGAGVVYAESTYPDGSPLPPHTYDYVQYDPVGNDFMLFKGQLELGPNVKAVAIPHMFNLDTLSWRHGPKHPAAILNSGGWTTWDSRRRVLWGNSGDAGGGNAFIGFHPDETRDDGTYGRWGILYPNKLPGVADHNAMQFDPGRDLILIAAHGTDSLYACNPDDPPAPLARLHEAAGRGRPRLSPYAALEFAPSLDSFIYYSAAEGKRLYALVPPSGASWQDFIRGEWRWTLLTRERAELDPITDAVSETSHKVNITHTFGRFRVTSFAGIDVAVLVRHVDSPVYAMRLN